MTNRQCVLISATLHIAQGDITLYGVASASDVPAVQKRLAARLGVRADDSRLSFEATDAEHITFSDRLL